MKTDSFTPNKNPYYLPNHPTSVRLAFHMRIRVYARLLSIKKKNYLMLRLGYHLLNQLITYIKRLT